MACTTRLTDEQILAIQRDKRSTKVIAKQYGIHHYYVRRLQRGFLPKSSGLYKDDDKKLLTEFREYGLALRRGDIIRWSDIADASALRCVEMVNKILARKAKYLGIDR